MGVDIANITQKGKHPGHSRETLKATLMPLTSGVSLDNDPRFTLMGLPVVKDAVVLADYKCGTRGWQIDADSLLIKPMQMAALHRSSC